MNKKIYQQPTVVLFLWKAAALLIYSY